MKALGSMLISGGTLCVMLCACGSKSAEHETVTIKTNEEASVPSSVSVTIGNKVWMTANLNVDTFRNGDSIPHIKTEEDWKRAEKNEQPAWCYYDNDPSFGVKYGKLYNWYAVSDPRGLAPAGWHIPSDEEWTTLLEQLGGNAFLDYLVDNNEAGIKMKATSGWHNSGNGTNESGFSGLPGGSRINGGPIGIAADFHHIGTVGYWWSSTSTSVGGLSAWSYAIFSKKSQLSRTRSYKNYGYSVRCIKEVEAVEQIRSMFSIHRRNEHDTLSPEERE